MKVYNSLGKQIYYDKDIWLGSGAFGKVYKSTNNTCVKIYNTEESERIEKEVFYLLKSLKLPNFYRLYELLYQNRWNIIYPQKPVGYISEYIEENEINILTMPTDYTLDNLYTLKSSIEQLIKNKVKITDLHSGNVIMNRNKITVIDADFYSIETKRTKEELKTRNLDQLAKLFIELYKDEIYYLTKVTGLNEQSNRNKIYDLFTENEELNIDKVFKKLRRYKYPIDYFK